MTKEQSAPDPARWTLHQTTVETSPAAYFLQSHFAPLGYAMGAAAAVAIVWATEAAGMSLGRVNNHQWWGIFPLLAIIAVVMVGHELAHYLLANWRHSRIVLVPNFFAVAVKLGGEFGRARYLACVLAPTAIGLALLAWGFQMDNPYIMAAATLNLAGSGLDWMTAVLAVMVLKSDRIYLDDGEVYLPRRA